MGLNLCMFFLLSAGWLLPCPCGPAGLRTCRRIRGRPWACSPAPSASGWCAPWRRSPSDGGCCSTGVKRLADAGRQRDSGKDHVHPDSMCSWCPDPATVFAPQRCSCSDTSFWENKKNWVNMRNRREEGEMGGWWWNLKVRVGLPVVSAVVNGNLNVLACGSFPHLQSAQLSLQHRWIRHYWRSER